MTFWPLKKVGDDPSLNLASRLTTLHLLGRLPSSTSFTRVGASSFCRREICPAQLWGRMSQTHILMEAVG